MCAPIHGNDGACDNEEMQKAVLLEATFPGMVVSAIAAVLDASGNEFLMLGTGRRCVQLVETDTRRYVQWKQGELPLGDGVVRGVIRGIRAVV